MAVTRTFTWYRGQLYCLLLDPLADSVEVVHQLGFHEPDEEDDVDFLPSYYEDYPAGGVWGTVMIRRLDTSDVPVGFMVENVTHRFRPRRRKEVPTLLEVIEVLFILAYKHLRAEAHEPTDELFEEVASEPAIASGRVWLPTLRINGDRVAG